MTHTAVPRSHPPRGRLASLAVGAALAVPLTLLAGPAMAEQDPLELTDRVTDEVGAVSGQEGEIQDSIAELEEETGLQLYVVYVDEFDRPDGGDWAEETYRLNGFGDDDILLAVAVDQRAYGSANDSMFSDSLMTSWRSNHVAPSLSEDDWAGAAVNGAQGLQELLPDGVDSAGTGAPPPSSNRPSPSGGGFSFPWFFAVPFIAIVGSKVVSSLGNRSARQSRQQTGPVPVEPQRTAQVPTQELQRQASTALVGLDNALRSAEEELTFAEAQFGRHRTEAFRTVLEQARGQSTEAFRLRQQLDEDQRQDDQLQRHRLGQIIELCSSAQHTLDHHAGEFAELRSLQDTVPEFLEELAGQVGEVGQRLPVADQQIQGLAARFPDQALATVRSHRSQAAHLLDSAHGFIDAGRDSVSSDDRPSAVAAARAAEESLGQAVRLLDAIGSADSDLSNAKEVLGRAIASLTSDVQDAGRLAPKDPVIQPVVRRAQEVIARAQAADTSGDPLAALAELDATEYDLDTLLDPLRDAEARRAKVREDFSSRISRVGARLRSIDETIATRRGAVNSGARTRISEALRLFQEAQQVASEDPRRAAELLTQAEQLGERALSEAQQDLDRWDGPGTGSGTRHSGGLDPISLILGGILAGGNRHSGGWGGGSWGGGGGGFGGGGFGGGGFGGGGGSFGGGVSSGGGRF